MSVRVVECCSLPTDLARVLRDPVGLRGIELDADRMAFDDLQDRVDVGLVAAVAPSSLGLGERSHMQSSTLDEPNRLGSVEEVLPVQHDHVVAVDSVGNPFGATPELDARARFLQEVCAVRLTRP